MDSTTRPKSATLATLTLSTLASALWIEHASRQAERRHHAPHHLMYLGGTRLHYQLTGPEDAPPVLLVHGNTVDSADFTASGLLQRLARDHRVLVIDRPGFGHSDRPRGNDWTPAQQGRLLLRVAEALGLHRPVVVGHSLGAQVALTMALAHPQDVAGLVLVSGYYFPSLRPDRWMAMPAALPLIGDVLRYTTAAWTARATLGGMVRAMFGPQPVPDRFWELMPREMLLRPLQQRAMAEDGWNMVPQARALARRYDQLRLPVTLVAGTADKVVSPEQAQRLHALLPQARLHLVEGVGHMAHYVAQGQIVAGVEAAADKREGPAGSVPAAGG